MVKDPLGLYIEGARCPLPLSSFSLFSFFSSSHGTSTTTFDGVTHAMFVLGNDCMKSTQSKPYIVTTIYVLRNLHGNVKVNDCYTNCRMRSFSILFTLRSMWHDPDDGSFLLLRQQAAIALEVQS